MLIVPLQPVPSQIVSVLLANQPCQIEVMQKSTGMFLNLSVNNSLIIGGVICENLNRIVRNAYLGFIGDLAFIDNEGTSDPDYTGLGSRFDLAYLEAAELPDDEG